MHDAISGPDVREITFLKGSQIGGTRWLLDAIGWWIDCDPGPTLYLSGTKEAAEDLSANRLRPMFERDCPPLAARRSHEKSHWKDDEFWFDACIVRLAGGRAVMGVSQHAQRYVILDELDKFKDDIEQRAADRVKTFRGLEKILKVSTPTNKTGRIWRSYLAGTQERFVVPCPHCGKEQFLQFDQIRWLNVGCVQRTNSDGTGALHAPYGQIADGLNPTMACKSAYYECEHCHGRIESRHKRQMLAAGRWIARFPERRVHRSFWLSSLYAPQLGWDYFAEKFLKCFPLDDDGCVVKKSSAMLDLLTLFKNEDLAEMVDPPGEAQTETSIREHQGLGTPHQYPPRVEGRPFCPIENPLEVIMYADVQHTACYYTVVAIGPWETCWLLDYGSVLGLDHLPVVYATQFHTPSGQLVRCTRGALDTSDGTIKRHTYAACRQNGWFACKNFDYSSKGGSDVWVGRPDEPGVRLLCVNTTQLKHHFTGKMRVSLGSPGAIHLPDQIGGDLIRHWTCESWVEEWTDKGLVGEWRPDHPDNHLYDAMIGVLAIANVLKLRLRSGSPAMPAPQPVPTPNRPGIPPRPPSPVRRSNFIRRPGDRE